MATTRAKFRVDAITRRSYTKYETGSDGVSRPVPTEMRTLILTPVYGNGDPNHENTKFWQATPQGQLELGCVNLAAVEQFDIGQEVYVDLTPVPKADPKPEPLPQVAK